MISTATFNASAMLTAADAEALVATDIAEWLVQKGMPFRQAHGVVGAVVRESLATQTPMVELVKAHPQLGQEVAALFDAGVAVQRRQSPGAAGPLAADVQKLRLHAAIAEAKGRLQ
jgi:argininosuccinate lyase